MADFDERSGIVSCTTPWGLWYQTLDEVSIEIIVDKGIKAKDVSINHTCSHLSVSVAGKQLIDVSSHFICLGLLCEHQHISKQSAYMFVKSKCSTLSLNDRSM